MNILCLTIIRKTRVKIFSDTWNSAWCRQGYPWNLLRHTPSSRRWFLLSSFFLWSWERPWVPQSRVRVSCSQADLPVSAFKLTFDALLCRWHQLFENKSHLCCNLTNCISITAYFTLISVAHCAMVLASVRLKPYDTTRGCTNFNTRRCKIECKAQCNIQLFHIVFLHFTNKLYLNRIFLCSVYTLEPN